MFLQVHILDRSMYLEMDVIENLAMSSPMAKLITKEADNLSFLHATNRLCNSRSLILGFELGFNLDLAFTLGPLHIGFN